MDFMLRLDRAPRSATCNSLNTGSQRVRRRRDKLRAAGLRPVQIWVPDTRAPGFVEECARQSRLAYKAALRVLLQMAERLQWGKTLVG